MYLFVSEVQSLLLSS